MTELDKRFLDNVKWFEEQLIKAIGQNELSRLLNEPHYPKPQNNEPTAKHGK